MSLRPRLRLLPALILGPLTCAAAEKLPQVPFQFIGEHCLECHDADTEKGKVNLDFLEVDWASEDQVHLLERVHRVLEDGEMPPKKRDQPETGDRKAMLAWLDESLTRKVPIGGTPLRRLNREEYVNSVDDLFGLRYQLPLGFPPDTRKHGFANQGDGLVVSPPLLEAYTQSAAEIADLVFPPPMEPVARSRSRVTAEDMSISYSSGVRADGAMRLANRSNPMSRSASWPTKFEAKGSGIYHVEVRARAFAPRPGSEPMRLQILARTMDANDGVGISSLRLLKELEVKGEQPQTFKFKGELYRGETLVYFYANAELDSDREDKDTFEAALRRLFEADQRLLAGWMAVKHNQGLRGGVGWERVKKQMADPALDLSKAVLDSPEGEKLIKTMTGNPVQYVETVSYQYFEQGPALDVLQTTIEGPFEAVIDPATRAQLNRREAFLGKRGEKQSEEDWVRGALDRFLTKTFRRPAEPKLVNQYQELFDRHRQTHGDFDAAMHLVVRTALASPNFLYRSKGEGLLDEYEMASRLSYFLTSAPPKPGLLEVAEKNRMHVPEALGYQTNKLLDSNASDAFIRTFAMQWLGLYELVNIMPDPKLGRFRDTDRRALELEAERFVGEMIRENRPLSDFIDPDFIYTSPDVASAIYGLDVGKKRGTNVTRMEVERGGPVGGLLGLAGVMMATANGVDTQPVLRGMWVLENVLGDPPPPPPEAVPAITPDTRGAKTVRDLMAAHTSAESCARCHQKIDPLGFVLENFDPIGKWREDYPSMAKGQKEIPIDASGTMPDGTALRDVRDLKRYVVENLDQFATCLAEKYFTYGTGRSPNYGEHKQLAQIAKQVLDEEGGARDLLLRVIQSRPFRTK